MKICMILEGCYPYVRGGVSSWSDSYIRGLSEHEFILWTIGTDARQKGIYKYTLPENVIEVHEVFLNDAFSGHSKLQRNYKLSIEEKQAIEQFIRCEHPDWNILFSLMQKNKVQPIPFLMSETFLDILQQICREEYPNEAFAKFFHSIRSMMLTLLYMMCLEDIPQADVYHAVSTGYAGLLAALGKWKFQKPMVLTEHGIYTREREEELLRATWTKGRLKEQWIQYFDMLASLAYEQSDIVTSLFQRAANTQIELGCNAEKCVVIGNGIHYDKLQAIEPKEEDGIVDIAAVVRLAPIKDIKTMLYAFHELQQRQSNVRLHILGDTDDEQYAQECFQLLEQLNIQRVIFTGSVNIFEYLKGIDFTILTSISEGQPLSILESFAAQRPCVTTDVGCCRELIYGEKDDPFGDAGIVVPPLQKSMLANALETLVCDKELRKKMGIAGQERVKKYYQHKNMIQNYNQVYLKLENKQVEKGCF